MKAVDTCFATCLIRGVLSSHLVHCRDVVGEAPEQKRHDDAAPHVGQGVEQSVRPVPGDVHGRGCGVGV